MKKHLLRVCLLCMLSLSLFLTGCAGSFFGGADEIGKTIVEAKAEPLENGNTLISFVYSDGTEDSFEIQQGEDGPGIKNISYSTNYEDHSTQLRINFTSDAIEPVTFNIPHGVSVYNVDRGTDPETNEPYIQFIYNDGTRSSRFTLPKGDKGNGISFHDYVTNDDQSIDLIFRFDDGEEMIVPIPAPEAGLGITKIEPREEGDMLYLDITYTNGTTASPSFERPNKWYKGGYDPSQSAEGALLGNDGDYFFDTWHKAIFVKENGSWTPVVSFADETSKHTITFNLNDQDGGVAATMSGNASYSVTRGTYFSDVVNGNNTIPVPRREGYTFAGWYTRSVVTEEESATMSAFTDLTPVFGDLTLYAIWR